MQGVGGMYGVFAIEPNYHFYGKILSDDPLTMLPVVIHDI